MGIFDEFLPDLMPTAPLGAASSDWDPFDDQQLLRAFSLAVTPRVRPLAYPTDIGQMPGVEGPTPPPPPPEPTPLPELPGPIPTPGPPPTLESRLEEDPQHLLAQQPLKELYGNLLAGALGPKTAQKIASIPAYGPAAQRAIDPAAFGEPADRMPLPRQVEEHTRAAMGVAARFAGDLVGDAWFGGIGLVAAAKGVGARAAMLGIEVVFAGKLLGHTKEAYDKAREMYEQEGGWTPKVTRAVSELIGTTGLGVLMGLKAAKTMKGGGTNVRDANRMRQAQRDWEAEGRVTIEPGRPALPPGPIAPLSRRTAQDIGAKPAQLVRAEPVSPTPPRQLGMGEPLEAFRTAMEEAPSPPGILPGMPGAAPTRLPRAPGLGPAPTGAVALPSRRLVPKGFTREQLELFERTPRWPDTPEGPVDETLARTAAAAIHSVLENQAAEPTGRLIIKEDTRGGLGPSTVTGVVGVSAARQGTILEGMSEELGTPALLESTWHAILDRAVGGKKGPLGARQARVADEVINTIKSSEEYVEWREAQEPVGTQVQVNRRAQLAYERLGEKGVDHAGAMDELADPLEKDPRTDSEYARALNALELAHGPRAVMVEGGALEFYRQGTVEAAERMVQQGLEQGQKILKGYQYDYYKVDAIDVPIGDTRFRYYVRKPGQAPTEGGGMMQWNPDAGEYMIMDVASLREGGTAGGRIISVMLLDGGKLPPLHMLSPYSFKLVKDAADRLGIWVGHLDKLADDVRFGKRLNDVRRRIKEAEGAGDVEGVLPARPGGEPPTAPGPTRPGPPGSGDIRPAPVSRDAVHPQLTPSETRAELGLQTTRPTGAPPAPAGPPPAPAAVREALGTPTPRHVGQAAARLDDLFAAAQATVGEPPPLTAPPAAPVSRSQALLNRLDEYYGDNPVTEVGREGARKKVRRDAASLAATNRLAQLEALVRQHAPEIPATPAPYGDDISNLARKARRKAKTRRTPEDSIAIGEDDFRRWKITLADHLTEGLDEATLRSIYAMGGRTGDLPFWEEERGGLGIGILDKAASDQIYQWGGVPKQFRWKLRGFDRLEVARAGQWRTAGPLSLAKQALADPKATYAWASQKAITKIFNKRYPLYTMVPKIEELTGRKFDPGADPRIISALNSGGGLGPAVPVVNDIMEIVAGAHKDGVLDPLRKLLDLVAWNRVYQAKEGKIEELKTQADLQARVRKENRQIGGLKAQLTKDDKRIADAIAAGDEELAAMKQEGKAARLNKLAEWIRTREKAAKTDPALRKAIAGKLKVAERLLYGKKNKKGEIVTQGLVDLVKEGKMVPLGYTPEDVRAALADYETLPEDIREKTDKWAKKLWAINDQMLDLYYQSGLISEKLFEDLKARGSGYVPLYRISEVFTEIRNEHGMMAAKLSLSRWRYLQRFQGSSLMTWDPFDASAVAAIRAISDIGRNETARVMVDAMMDAPDLSGFRKVNSRESTEQAKARVRKADFGEAKSVPVWREGKRETYVGPADLVDTLEWNTPVSAGIFTKALVVAARSFRITTTGASIRFLARNISRDLQGSRDISWAYQHKRPGTRSLYALNLWRKALQDVIEKGPEWRAFHTSRAAFSTMMGQMTMERQFALPSQSRLMRKERGEGVAGTGAAKYDVAIGWLEDIGNAIEMTNKIAGQLGLEEFGKTIKARRKGLMKQLQELPPGSKEAKTIRDQLTVVSKLMEEAPLHPLQLAHEVRYNVGTPDAAWRGEYGPELNAMFMFWNVGARGKIRMLERFAENPKRFLFPLMIYGTGLATIFLLNNVQYRHRDGKLMWEHIPADQRDNNFILFYPDWMLDLLGMPHTTAEGMRPYAKAAKGDDWKVIVNPLEAMMYGFFGADVELYRHMVASATAAVPVPGVSKIGEEEGVSAGMEWLRGVGSEANPLIRTPAEMFANENLYTSVPIENAYDLRHSAPFRFTERTSPTMVAASKALNVIGWQISPKMAEHLVKSSLTGVAELYLSVTDPIAAQFLEPTTMPRPAGPPGLKPLIDSLSRPGRRDGIREEMRSRFFRESERVTQQWNDWRDHGAPEGTTYDTVKELADRRRFLESGKRRLGTVMSYIRKTADEERRAQLFLAYDQLLYLLAQTPEEQAQVPAGPPTFQQPQTVF